MHWWTQKHKQAWKSTKDNSGGWSENPLHGEEKPLHNIQPREEHSPGGRRVYNQEKTSPEQTQRLHHKLPVQTSPKNILTPGGRRSRWHKKYSVDFGQHN